MPAILLLLALVGCASVDVESFDRQGEQHQPVAGKDVEIFQDAGAVKRPFRRVGALHWNARNPKEGSVDAALREEAGRIGANGVIKVRGDATVTGPFFWPVEHVSGFADAIRFEE